jgi:RNA polymerase sigma-70 factor, ECF subfamily
MHQNEKDEEIALKVQKGDTESFGVLIERYEKKLTRYARKFISNNVDITDLVQDVFVKAYTNIQSFDAERKFSSWIYRIAHNEFVNALKKKKWELFDVFNVDVFFPHAVSQETADQDTLSQDLKKTLDACLDKIDPKYREPLVLYYYEELSYQEMADVLHIPVSTVGIRLRRGKSLLKKVYNDLDKKYEQ